MKTVYASKTRLFANKDVAIIATNTSNITEISVPINTEVIESGVHIEVSTASKYVYFDLTNTDFDRSEIADYLPNVKFDVEEDSNDQLVSDLDSFETIQLDKEDESMNVNWEWSDLSQNLRDEIVMKVDDALI